MSPLFLFVHLSDFFFGMSVQGQSPTFLLLPLIFVHVRKQVIAHLDLGQAATTLLSKSQSSFAKRASGLYGGEGGKWGLKPKTRAISPPGAHLSAVNPIPW
jgi:hypothetical protein